MERRDSPWVPYPPGVYMAFLFGLFSVYFMLAMALGFAHPIFCGLASLAFGSLAIHNCLQAAYTAGMRAEAYSKYRGNQFVRSEDKKNWTDKSDS